jgi:glucose/arabinose dehydrogenase
MDFGEDGKLYTSTGDNETPDNAQQPTNLFGKMLRINKDGTIPTSNPFYATYSGKNRAIWALGLRNPFKFAVKPGGTALFINDAGEDDWEEINRGTSGANYGWPVHEGVANDPSYVDPICAYGHDSTDPPPGCTNPDDPPSTVPTGCAITGGAFYNPATVQFPSRYVGDYFFADLCGGDGSGWIWRYDPETDRVSRNAFATGLGRLVDLEVSKDGELYYLRRDSPTLVGKIRYTGN